jgi:WD40 repeat protein
MKESKPKFRLVCVDEDGLQVNPTIVPLSQTVEAKMNRRGFIGAGLTAAAALMLLDGCKKDEPNLLPEPELEYPNKVSSQRLEDCEDIYAHNETINVLAVNFDGTRLFSGSADRTIKIWSLPDGALIQTLNEHTDDVYSLAVSPDGRWLFSGSWDGLIRIWSLPDGTPVRTLTGDSEVIVSLAVSPDGKLLFAGNADKTITIWSLPDGMPVKTLTEHSGVIYSLAVSPDGKRLFSGSGDKTVKIWKLPEGIQEKTLTRNYPIHSLAIIPDGKWMFAGDSDGLIELIKLPDGIVTRKMKAITGLYSSIDTLTVSPDGKWLASSNSRNNFVQLWSLPDLVLKTEIFNNSIAIFSGDSQWLVFGTGIDGKIQLRKLPELISNKCLLDLACVENTVKGLTYNVTDESGRTITYTLPCGSPIPANTTCLCHCVPGEKCSRDSQCTCNSQCTCDNNKSPCSFCTCVPVMMYSV